MANYLNIQNIQTLVTEMQIQLPKITAPTSYQRQDIKK